MQRIIFHSEKALGSSVIPSARLLVRDVATKESWSRDASILPKHFTDIYIVEQETNKSGGEAKSYLKAMSKTPSKRETNFYLKMTVTMIIVG